MSKWAILAALAADDARNPMYPEVGADLEPVFEPADGLDTIQPEVHGMRIYRTDSNGKLVTIAGGHDLRGELWITDQRVVVACRKYDKARWNRRNTQAALFYGFTGEVAWHMGEKVYHRVRSHNKTLAGHIYLPWIRSVGWEPRRDRKHPGELRFGITVPFAGGVTENLYLAVNPDESRDLPGLAREVVQRVCKWHLAHNPMTDEQREALSAMSGVERLPAPPPGRLATYRLPVYRQTGPINIPAAFRERALQAAAQAAGSPK